MIVIGTFFRFVMLILKDSSVCQVLISKMFSLIMFFLIDSQEFGEVFGVLALESSFVVATLCYKAQNISIFIKWLGGRLPSPLFCFILALDISKNTITKDVTRFSLKCIKTLNPDHQNQTQMCSS